MSELTRTEAALEMVKVAGDAVGDLLDKMVAVMADALPDRPGSEQLLALDVVALAVERLRRLGVTVVVPEVGPPQFSGLLPGGLTEHRREGRDQTRAVMVHTIPTVPGPVPVAFGDSPLRGLYQTWAKEAALHEARIRQARNGERETEDERRAGLSAEYKALSPAPRDMDYLKACTPGQVKLEGPFLLDDAGKAEMRRVFAGSFAGPGSEPTVGCEGTIDGDPALVEELTALFPMADCRLTVDKVVRDGAGKVVQVLFTLHPTEALLGVPAANDVPQGFMTMPPRPMGMPAPVELRAKGCGGEADPIEVWAEAIQRAAWAKLDADMMAGGGGIPELAPLPPGSTPTPPVNFGRAFGLPPELIGPEGPANYASLSAGSGSLDGGADNGDDGDGSQKHPGQRRDRG